MNKLITLMMVGILLTSAHAANSNPKVEPEVSTMEEFVQMHSEQAENVNVLFKAHKFHNLPAKPITSKSLKHQSDDCLISGVSFMDNEDTYIGVLNNFISFLLHTERLPEEDFNFVKEAAETFKNCGSGANLYITPDVALKLDQIHLKLKEIIGKFKGKDEDRKVFDTALGLLMREADVAKSNYKTKGE